jgi:transcriptional activator SPT7
MSSLVPSQWQRLHATREDSLQRADRTRTTSADPAADTIDKDDAAVDPVAAAFRERYIMFEKSIPSLFRTDYPCCSAPELDLASLDLEDVHMQDMPNGSASGPPLSQPARATAEDDDYDFDEDEDDSPPKPAQPPLSLASKLASSQSRSAEPATTGAGEAKSVTATREQLEADRKAAEEAAKSAISTMFFTLENDQDAMLEQQKLEESDRQVNAEANASQENAPGKLSSANLGASSLTLKHLIARIDAKRERVECSDTELRNLMSEVRKNRSKWASEEKIGQEELYEAAEKVVLELRAMTEHSTAFLNRVNKREAPDYYHIIRHPMDLSTVMKKLKAHQYRSKKEFVEDLDLIWSNCLKYNADPSHFLRKHAKAMQKMTQSLEPLIPDITIRDRAEVEAEEAGAVEVDAEGESDDGEHCDAELNTADGLTP